MLKKIIFDFDDTLVHTTKADVSLYNDLLDKFNMPHMNHELISYMTRSSPESLLAKIFGKDNPNLQKAIELRREIPPNIEKLELFPGVRECLSELSKKYKLAIATSRTSSVLIILKHFNLDTYFSKVITIDNVTHPKPHPEMILKALENTLPLEAAYIGDNENDEVAAKNAGVYFVGFRTNAKNKFEDYSKLQEVLEKITS